MTAVALQPLIIAGNPEPVHLGAHLLAAARRMGIDAEICDSREAFAGTLWRQKADWWLRGHRPPQLRDFSESVVAAVRTRGARCVLTTGLAPLDRSALRSLAQAGTLRLNYLSDDPWNPAHRAPWFMSALTEYDVVFTPRHANMPDLTALSGPAVRYLPFAYAPDQHFREAGPADRARYESDVMFAGGADPDRVAVVQALIAAGLSVALYGGYWDRHRATRAAARGHLDPVALRHAVSGARICLSLVRRANRDGNSMRTYELPAMGGCVLAERTPDHEALFGPDGEAALYFDSIGEAVEKARWLLLHEDLRRRLAARAHAIVTAGGHTYDDRLATLLRIGSTISRNEDRFRHSGALSRV